MYIIGLDFGTLSVRAVLVDLESGSVLSTAVTQYKHGVIDERIPESGITLKPQWALQEPQDWLDSMTAVVRSVLKSVDDVTEVVGLGMDSTSSTVLPVLKDGSPLYWLPEWRNNPHAWPKLWKHSAAQDQATRLTEAAGTPESTKHRL
jgi:L-ribulokinase